MGSLQLYTKSWIPASGSVPPSLSFPPYWVPEANGGSGSGKTMTHLERSQSCRPSPRAPTGGWGGKKKLAVGSFPEAPFVRRSLGLRLLVALGLEKAPPF